MRRNLHVELILTRLSSEPFRLFFPLGIFYALLGVGYWLMLLTGVMTYELGSLFHVQVQIYGFLTAFVFGFLGTALPRLTEAPAFRVYEVSGLMVLQCAGVFFSAANQFWKALVCFEVTLLFFVFALALRFLKRKKNPPEPFVFLPFGFLSALLGTLFLILSNFPEKIYLSYEFSLWGRVLAYQAYPLFLILGVGGFLIRSILGRAAALPIQQSDKLVLPKFQSRKMILLLFMALILFAGFLLEGTKYFMVGRVLKFLMIVLICAYQIQVFHPRKSTKLTSMTLKLSVLSMVVGYAGLVFISDVYQAAWLHVIFIGGFSLITLSIATRVSLSHCGFGMLLNQAWTPIALSMIIVAISLISRMSADYFPEVYTSHLFYAGIFWLVGVGIWSGFILPKIFKTTFRE